MATPWVGTKPGLFVNDSSSPVAVDAPNLNAMVDTVDRLNEQKSLLSGLVCAPAFGGLPEWPDGPSPTYFQDAWATADSWAGVAGGGASTVAVSGGELVCSKTADSVGYARATRAIAAGTLKTYRAKIRLIQSTTSLVVYGTVGGVGDTILQNLGSKTAGTIFTTDFYVAGDVTNLFINFVTVMGQTGPVFAINWIYIGDGTNTSLALDSSGNGNHGTVYGATPVNTMAGRGLRRDGINDYAKVDNFTLPSIFTFHSVKHSGGVGAVQSVGIFNVGAVTGAHLWIYRALNTNTLVISYWNGTARVEPTISNFFLDFDATPMSYDIVLNWATGGVLAYRNGTLFGSLTLTTPTIPATGTAYFGCYQNANNFGLVETTETDPRIYNRALSAEEVWFLYQNPGAFKPTAIIDATTAVPNARAVYSSTGFLASTDPTSIVTAGSVGYQTAIDVASGGTLTMPAGSGTYFWTILTYGATINSVKLGTTAAGAAATGTASANLTVLVKRIS